MKQFKTYVDFSYIVICVLVGLSQSISVFGEHVKKGEPATPAMIVPDRFDIQGAVMDATLDFSKDYFAKIAASASDKEFRQALKGMPRPQPVPNVVVTLQSESFTKKTITDSKGNFKFTGLPAGDHELSAQAPSRPTGIRGVTRMAIAKERFRLDSNRRVDLRLCTDLVAVRGRITDVDGKPVAGAKVTAILQVHDQGYLQNHDPPKWSTVSNVDGFYELQGLGQTDFYHLAGYLQEGEPHALERVDIYVEADGFEQSKANMPRVPLVTEELLGPARRLLKAMSQMAQRAGGSELREKDGLSFPTSHDNTITGIDIVLKKAGKGTQ